MNKLVALLLVVLLVSDDGCKCKCFAVPPRSGGFRSSPSVRVAPRITPRSPSTSRPYSITSPTRKPSPPKQYSPPALRPGHHITTMPAPGGNWFAAYLWWSAITNNHHHATAEATKPDDDGMAELDSWMPFIAIPLIAAGVAFVTWFFWFALIREPKRA